MAIVAVPELEHFNYAVYVSEQLASLFGYLIADRGISQLHLVNESMAQQEAKIFLYLGVAHVGAVHDLRLARAVLADSEHISYYLYIRPSPVHTTNQRLTLSAIYHYTTPVELVKTLLNLTFPTNRDLFPNDY